jgi:hypothetical protein
MRRPDNLPDLEDLKDIPDTKKVIISRTVLLFALVIAAGLFAVAVHEDRSDGTLMDADGVIDEASF